MVIVVLWDQFRSQAQPHLNLLSDVLGQAPLRAFADRAEPIIVMVIMSASRSQRLRFADPR
jgi:hypothetical protein